LDTLRFSAPLWSLGTTYDVHLGLIEKRVVDFLLVLIELFSIGVTAEAQRAKIDRKSAISLQRGQFDPKFQVERVAPSIIFALITNYKANQCLTTLSLTVFTKLFTQKNFVADFLKVKGDFTPKTAVLRF